MGNASEQGTSSYGALLTNGKHREKHPCASTHRCNAIGRKLLLDIDNFLCTCVTIRFALFPIYNRLYNVTAQVELSDAGPLRPFSCALPDTLVQNSSSLSLEGQSVLSNERGNLFPRVAKRTCGKRRACLYIVMPVAHASPATSRGNRMYVKIDVAVPTCHKVLKSLLQLFAYLPPSPMSARSFQSFLIDLMFASLSMA